MPRPSSLPRNNTDLEGCRRRIERPLLLLDLKLLNVNIEPIVPTQLQEPLKRLRVPNSRRNQNFNRRV